jgi:hypothetical protein
MARLFSPVWPIEILLYFITHNSRSGISRLVTLTEAQNQNENSTDVGKFSFQTTALCKKKFCKLLKRHFSVKYFLNLEAA